MKVLLIKDVYKLGRAGDVKKVADGFGRNFLIPQGMAVLATEGAMKQAERIRTKAADQRAIANEEMAVVAEAIKKIKLTFSARAGETGKLYGSITSQEIADALQKKSGFSIKRQQLDMQPLRTLGEHVIRIRLTMDLIPEIIATVYREGEAEPSIALEEKVKEPVPAPRLIEEPLAEPMLIEEPLAEAEVILEPVAETKVDESQPAEAGENTEA